MSLEQEDTTLELARLRSALDRTLTAMMMIDRDLVITYANKATLELMRAREETLRATYPGFSVDTLIGSCIDMFHADASHQRKLLADPANLPFSTDIKVADLVFNIQVTAQRDTDGAYIGNTLEWHDVTEQRRVESEMKDFTAKFAAISRAQAYIEFDVDGTIIDANENFLGALGYARDEVVGRHHRMFVEPEHASSPEYRALWERLQRGEYASGEFKRIAKGGNEVWIQASYCPVLDDSGKPYKVVKYASDITARKTAFNRCESIMAAIAEGDLTRLMEGEYSGDLAALQAAVNDTVTRLRDMVEKIRTSALSINSAASEVAKGNTELSARTEEQASSLEETAASMEEMTSTVQQNADNSRQANQLASSARDQASEGGEVVGRAVSAMAEINESSKKIADIIGVIDEIAFQTNLLALNAAVEAARAGEQGRGFAVVASEVRNLAQRSASAAKEIKALISDSVQKVTEGSKLVDASGSTLEEIVNSVKKVSDIIGEIAVASEEQSSGISQVNQAVTQMDQMTQQNAALVEQAAAASESMDEESRALIELIQFFRTGQSTATVHTAPARPAAPQVERRGADRPWSNTASGARATAPRTAPMAQAAAGGSDVWEEF